ncbi:uncharacterized protein [Lolium perenne]|uniref:uncharacterized protein isoform X1 n=1 Tax=Lolium perenne TaxID=4522 RepID=UPI003A995E97
MMYTGCSAPAWHGSDAGWTYGACLQAPSFTGGYTVWLCSSPDRTEKWSWPGGSGGFALPLSVVYAVAVHTGQVEGIESKFCIFCRLFHSSLARLQRWLDMRCVSAGLVAYRRIYGVAWLRCRCRGCS